MSLLDRYIARLYAINVLTLIVIIFSFVVTIDVAFNVERYHDAARELLDAEGSGTGRIRETLATVMIVADLWWPRLLNLYNVMLGSCLVIAMGFTAAQLVRHRELVAVLASGQSLFRVFRPFLVIGVGFVFLQAINTELVIPRIAPLLLRDPGDAGVRTLDATSVPTLTDSAGRRFYARSFDPGTDTLQGVYIWETDEHGIATVRIDAAEARWDGTAWVFDPPARVLGRAQTVSPTATLERLETDLDPSALRIRRYEGLAQSLSWAQTGEMVRLIRRQGDDTRDARRQIDRLERIRYGRISVALCNLLALAVCLPFFVTALPTGLLTQSAKCAPIAVVALVGGAAGPSLSIPGLPPAISVLIPALILAPAAVATLTSVRT
ncbi:MAG: LptF/LptG family permease [Planctomycetota bacterium]